jgi:hypothetical protein
MENLALIKPKTKKMKPITRRRHNYIYLLSAILLAITSLYILKNYPPFYQIPFMNVGIPILPLFFLSLAGFIYSLLTFIFIQKTQGIIVSFFIILYLILRILGLTHWAFGVIVLVLFIISEVYILKKNKI